MTRPVPSYKSFPRLVTGGVERGTVEVAAALTAAGQGNRRLGRRSDGAEIEDTGGIHL